MYRIAIEYRDDRPTEVIEFSGNYDEAYQKLYKLYTSDVKKIGIS